MQPGVVGDTKQVYEKGRRQVLHLQKIQTTVLNKLTHQST